MEQIQPINLTFLLQISNNVLTVGLVILGTCQKLGIVLEPCENKTKLHAKKGRAHWENVKSVTRTFLSSKVKVK